MLQEIELPFGNINHNDHLKMVELIRKINSHYHKEIMFLGGKFMANFVDPTKTEKPTAILQKVRIIKSI